MDTTPSEVNVEQFAYHLLAEFEQLALTEKCPGTRSDPQKPKPQEAEKPKVSKFKKLEEETKSPPRREVPREEKPKCKLYLSEQGCRRGKACNWSHDQKDERGRCWNCGSTWLQLAFIQKTEVMHLQQSPRSRRSRGRIHHLQAQSEGRRRVNRRPVHERIAGASQLLKSLTTTAASSTATGSATGSREEVMD